MWVSLLLFEYSCIAATILVVLVELKYFSSPRHQNDSLPSPSGPALHVTSHISCGGAGASRGFIGLTKHQRTVAKISINISQSHSQTATLVMPATIDQHHMP